MKALASPAACMQPPEHVLRVVRSANAPLHITDEGGG